MKRPAAAAKVPVPMDPAAVIRITIHVLEIVAVAIVVLIYLLVRLWRRI